MVLVKKTDGSMRFCIYYRELNRNTVKEDFPIPHTQDIFNALSGANFFTKLDLEAAYDQIEMHLKDREKTGFIIQDGCSE